MSLPYFAAGSLGIIVGWLIWTFIHRSKSLTVQAISSLASLASGGVVIAAASWRAPTDPGDAVYVYPIGALFAIIVRSLLPDNLNELK